MAETEAEAAHLSVAVDVCLADHLVDLLVGELLAEIRHHVSQLRRADEPVAVLVEHSARTRRTPMLMLRVKQ